MPFSNTTGLFALLSIVPLIIFYLIKPKPQDRTIPSLMFLIKDQHKAASNSLFRKFMRNLLFLIQLLALIGLSLAVAEPYINTSYDIASTHTVIVLDVSGSMQAQSGSSTRFEKAIGEAKSALSRRNTIILAEEIPLVVLENEGEQMASEVLSGLTPRATSTNLGDAMIVAKGILGGKDGRVIVISDFSNVKGPDLLAIEKTMTSKDISVDFIDVSKKAGNIGIVNLEVGKHKTKAYVKNFNDKASDVAIKLVNSGTTKANSKLNIASKSIESVVFDTPEGISTIEIDAKGADDGLRLDDSAYISNPLGKQVNVLLITNTAKTALESSLLASPDIDLKVVNPPVLTLTTSKEKISPYEQEVIIIHQINKNELLPGTFEDLRRYVEKGGNLIITAQPDLNQINTINLNPVAIKELSKEPSRACIGIFNEFTKQFESEGCFASMSRHFKADVVTGAAKMASSSSSLSSSSSSSGDAILATIGLKAGTVVYYGIIDKESDFSTLPSYPIFWSDLINFLVKSEKIGDYNFKAGKVMSISIQKVKTPSGTVQTDKLVLDEQGIYEIGSRKIAVNMLDEAESDVSSEYSMFKKGKEQLAAKTEQAQKKFNLDILLLGAVFLLLSFETFYIKLRGDI